jgi:hypothetical protein
MAKFDHQIREGVKMKRITVIAFTSIALLAASHTAEARKVSISQKTTLAQLQAICDAVGGSFWSNNDGYSCLKANCDGKGNSCTVFCDANGNCEGYVPKPNPKQGNDLRGILNPSIKDIK